MHVTCPAVRRSRRLNRGRTFSLHVRAEEPISAAGATASCNARPAMVGVLVISVLIGKVGIRPYVNSTKTRLVPEGQRGRLVKILVTTPRDAILFAMIALGRPQISTLST